MHGRGAGAIVPMQAFADFPSLLTPASKYTSPTTAFLRQIPPIGRRIHAITMESFAFYFRNFKGWTLIIFSRPASSLLDGSILKSEKPLQHRATSPHLAMLGNSVSHYYAHEESQRPIHAQSIRSQYLLTRWQLL